MKAAPCGQTKGDYILDVPRLKSLRYGGALGAWVEESPPESGVLVRLDEGAYRSVVFLGWPEPDNEQNIDPVGTGFVVSSGVAGHNYLVTAAHVAHALGDSPFGVRLNDKSGVARVHRIEVTKWWHHPNDGTVDIALIPYQIPEWADCGPFPRRVFVTDVKRVEKNIGAGDMAYIVGLFLFLKGKTRNLPVVHVGHIATMADNELIASKDWRDKKTVIEIEGYLVSAHTLKEASGSPVFVRRCIMFETWTKQSPSLVKKWTHGTIWLLGVWKGAWFSEPSEIVPLPRESVNERVAAGMGVTVPARMLIDVMDQDELKKIRDADEQAKKDEDALTVQGIEEADAIRDAALKKMLETPPRSRD